MIEIINKLEIIFHIRTTHQTVLLNYYLIINDNNRMVLHGVVFISVSVIVIGMMSFMLYKQFKE